MAATLEPWLLGSDVFDPVRRNGLIITVRRAGMRIVKFCATMATESRLLYGWGF